MQWFLLEELDIIVSQPTISRVLRQRRWSRKIAQRIGINRNNELRAQWHADLLRVTAEQLVFIDESMFNESTGWRRYAWAPIGQAARYRGSRTRGKFGPFFHT